MTSLLLTTEEAKEEADYSMPEPKYPYGTTIELNKDTLEKLGMATLPQVGTQMGLAATVIVTSVSQSESVEGEPYMCVNLQITDMELTQATQDRSDLDRANTLYGA